MYSIKTDGSNLYKIVWWVDGKVKEVLYNGQVFNRVLARYKIRCAKTTTHKIGLLQAVHENVDVAKLISQTNKLNNENTIFE